MDDKFKSNMISGISWSTVAQIQKQTLNFVISIILAGLLSPDAYGSIGMEPSL